MDKSNVKINITKKLKKIQPNTDNDIVNTNANTDTDNDNINDNDKLDKFDILEMNASWNDKNEKFIVSIGENSASYKYMHEKVAVRYITYDRIIKIYTTIATVVLTANFYTTFFQTSIVGSIVQTVIGTILSITSLIYNFLNYAELSKDHTHSASSFGILYHDIRNIMCLYRKDRPNAIRYIQHAIKEYDHLEVNGANIPDWQLADFAKKFKNKDISMPDVADRIQKIEIISEPGNYNIDVLDNKINFKINNDNNLKDIQECFKIDGDLSEKDNLTVNDLLKRKENLNKQSEYQMSRFMSNSDDIV